MILQLTISGTEQRGAGPEPGRAAGWLEEIRSYWAGCEAQRAEEAAAVAGCAQRALAQALAGLEDASREITRASCESSRASCESSRAA